MLVLGLHSKDRKSTREKATISNHKVNRGCSRFTANRTPTDSVQISLGPSVQYISLKVYHTGGFNAMYWGKSFAISLHHPMETHMVNQRIVWRTQVIERHLFPGDFHEYSMVMWCVSTISALSVTQRYSIMSPRCTMLFYINVPGIWWSCAFSNRLGCGLFVFIAWQQQVSRAGTRNYIPQYLWGVITCLPL